MLFLEVNILHLSTAFPRISMFASRPLSFSSSSRQGPQQLGLGFFFGLRREQQNGDSTGCGKGIRIRCF